MKFRRAMGREGARTQRWTWRRQSKLIGLPSPLSLIMVVLLFAFVVHIGAF